MTRVCHQARGGRSFDSEVTLCGSHQSSGMAIADYSNMSGFGYPVTLVLTARPCLVVGGGVLAERNVHELVEAGARVTVVSPWLSRALLALATDGRFAWWPRAYAVGDAAGFFLAIVATDDRVVNVEVAAEARARGVLVHCSDDPALSDFAVAAAVPSGPLAPVASAAAPAAPPPRGTR